MKPVKVIVWIAAILAVAAAAGYWVFVRPMLQFAPLATAYGAKKVCSCVFVAGRDLEACKTDFTEDVSVARFIQESDAIRVEVDVPGQTHVERAAFTPGLGCALVPMDGG